MAKTIILLRAVMIAGEGSEIDAVHVVDDDTADTLIRHGLAAVHDRDDQTAEAARELEKMTVTELKALAEAKAIDLASASKKAEIIAVIIEAARAAFADQAT